jgi:hypothetical protein
MRPQVAMIAALIALPTAASAQPVAVERLRACLTIEDMTKERLDCFDAVVPPEPKPLAASPAAVAECRFYKEEGCSTALLQSLPCRARDKYGASGTAANTVRAANSG